MIVDAEQPHGDNKLVLFRVQQEGALGRELSPRRSYKYLSVTPVVLIDNWAL